jgi:hypothetical protein
MIVLLASLLTIGGLYVISHIMILEIGGIPELGSPNE